MTYRPTVGEVRKLYGTRVRVKDVGVYGRLWEGVAEDSGESHTFSIRAEPGRIVIVAPKNRARVTAGPAWMGAR